MFKLSYLIFYFGLFLLSLVTINEFTSHEITPSLQRAESIAGLASVVIITIGLLWDNITPKEESPSNLIGEKGFELSSDLSKLQSEELAWGSQLILTATAASTILIFWEGQTILKRGMISSSNFVPGEICRKAKNQQRLVSLVNTKLFPGSYEFDSIIKDLPSVIIYPISNKGWTIVGGWSKRCFTKSDEKWIIGWSDKISDIL